MRFADLQEVLQKGMSRSEFQALTEYLKKAEDMSNQENAVLHCEFGFVDLVAKVRDNIACA